MAIAKAAVARFEVSAGVLALDTKNFDTHIDTQMPGELARRGHAKSNRSDLRVVGLGVLISQTGHVPLLYRTYPGNGPDQPVRGMLGWVGAVARGTRQWRGSRLTGAEDGGTRRRVQEPATGTRSRCRRLLPPHLVAVGTQGCRGGLQVAAQRGAMKPLLDKLSDVRAARARTTVGALDARSWWWRARNCWRARNAGSRWRCESEGRTEHAVGADRMGPHHAQPAGAAG